MSDDELANSLARSVELRVRNVSPRPDVEDLLARMGNRASRQRRWYVVRPASRSSLQRDSAGYLIGTTNEDGRHACRRSAERRACRLPRRHRQPSSRSTWKPRAPRSSRRFTTRIREAHRTATRDEAIQDGDALQALRRDAGRSRSFSVTRVSSSPERRSRFWMSSSSTMRTQPCDSPSRFPDTAT